jgi:hypothetical protein
MGVDGNGNVFVSDYDNGLVKEMVAVNGVIPALPVAPCVSTTGASMRCRGDL